MIFSLAGLPFQMGSQIEIMPLYLLGVFFADDMTG
jgi:hypothetical protein